MNVLGSRPPWLVVTLSVCLTVTGCSRSSDDPAAPAQAATTSPSSDRGSVVGSVVASVVAPTATAEGSDSTTAPPSTTSSAATFLPSTPPATLAELNEVGVPGLDSDDAFCSSWSRFAGSFQVVAVTAAFGTGPADQLAALEVAASPTVTRAYDELFANWPEELAAEESVVADEFLGPFARRLADARAALETVGADENLVAVIADAWLAGLAARDPSTPEFVVDLPDDVWATIDEAAAVFGSQRVPFGSDPSLVTDVVTPLTDEYLAVSCPDQGTLSGQEVGTP